MTKQRNNKAHPWKRIVHKYAYRAWRSRNPEEAERITKRFNSRPSQSSAESQFPE